MSTVEPVHLETFEDGAIWRVVLATPKANLLDMEKSRALSSIFRRARDEQDLKAIVIEGQGPNFSFGSSVDLDIRGKRQACTVVALPFYSRTRKASC